MTTTHAQAPPNRTDDTKPNTPDLIGLAGLSALVAGMCYVLVGVFHPPNVSSSVTSTRWEVVHILACAMCVFGLLGMAGLYARQAKKIGRLGLAGFVIFSLWLVLIMGFSFVEAAILPRIATSDPGFVDGWFRMLTGSASTVNLGALSTLWTLTAPIYNAAGQPNGTFQLFSVSTNVGKTELNGVVFGQDTQRQLAGFAPAGVPPPRGHDDQAVACPPQQGHDLFRAGNVIEDDHRPAAGKLGAPQFCSFP